jgi:hypothetical protein
MLITASMLKNMAGTAEPVIPITKNPAQQDGV